MEGGGGMSNGGMLYHEVQEAKLCAVHCVNTVLQGPFFSEFDLAALASDLDSTERQMMQLSSLSTGDFLSADSHNVSLGGDFSIQVLQKALEVFDLQVITLDSPVAEHAQVDPDSENAFICHLHDHWFCIRKVNGEWYNFDSLYAAPEHLSKFYLAAYLDSLKSSGWSIFLVRGNFPKEFPISSAEASNGYGQWLSPEDAERIYKSCNSTRAPQRTNVTQHFADPFEDMVSDAEDEDLRAAIAASLMDSSQPMANIEASAGTENTIAATLTDSSHATDNVEASATSAGTEAAKAVALTDSSQAMANVEASTKSTGTEATIEHEAATDTKAPGTPQNPQNCNTSDETKGKS